MAVGRRGGSSTTTTEPVVAATSDPVTVQNISDGNIDTIDTNYRYLGYGARLRTLLIASSRYLAYTSDIGESFRPVIPPSLVRAAYGISWLYITADVSYEGYKTYHRTPTLDPQRNTIVALQMTKRSIFQVTASMALPAMTIHSLVRYSGKYIWSQVKNPRARAWGPTLTGLSFTPCLPFLFDEPVEYLIDRAWDQFVQ